MAEGNTAHREPTSLSGCVFIVQPVIIVIVAVKVSGKITAKEPFQNTKRESKEVKTSSIEQNIFLERFFVKNKI